MVEYRFAIKVILLGPSAAGKTTAASHLLRLLDGSDWNGDYVSIEDCQREVCPPGVEDGTYFYNQHGALVLLDREKNAASARDRFVQKCLASGVRGFVAEFGQPNAPAFLLAKLSDLLPGTLILYLSAPLAVRRERNENKSALRMPEDVLTWIEETMSDDLRAELQGAGAEVRCIDANVPIAQLLASVAQAMQTYRTQKMASQHE